MKKFDEVGEMRKLMESVSPVAENDDKCSTCSDPGVPSGSISVECDHCNGNGEDSDGSQCDECNGNGWTDQPCPECGADGAINEDEQLNKYTKSLGYNGTTDMIYRLGRMLDPNSNLSKNIQKSMGVGYHEDFAKMKMLIDKITDIWEEVEMQIDQQHNEFEDDQDDNYEMVSGEYSSSSY